MCGMLVSPRRYQKMGPASLDITKDDMATAPAARQIARAHVGVCDMPAHCRTHMSLLPARLVRTSCLFLPASRSGGTNLPEVRAHIRRFPGAPHAHVRVSWRFSPPEARTSPCFLPPGRDRGGKQPQVRERVAGKRHMCARGTHLPRLAAIQLAGTRHKCANPWREDGTCACRHAHPPLPVHPLGKKRAHVRDPNPRAHAHPITAQDFTSPALAGRGLRTSTRRSSSGACRSGSRSGRRRCRRRPPPPSRRTP